MMVRLPITAKDAAQKVAVATVGVLVAVIGADFVDPILAGIAGVVVSTAIGLAWRNPVDALQAGVISAQATRIEGLQDEIIGQREQIGELEYRTGWTNSPAGIAAADAVRRKRERYGPTHGSR